MDKIAIRRVAATVVTLAALTLAGCSTTGKPDVAACEQAMREQYQTGLANPDAPAASRPAACDGVDDKTLQELVAKIMSG